MARYKAPVISRSFGRGSKVSLEILTELRAVVYSPVSERIRWIEHELSRSSTPSVAAHSVAHVVTMLVGSLAGVRPRLAVIDLDAMSAGDLFHLHQVREHGWTGTLIALGKVPASLRSSLGIDRTVAPPYVEDVLFEELAQHVQDSQASTMPIPIPLL
jgi:hypothetical protein